MANVTIFYAKIVKAIMAGKLIVTAKPDCNYPELVVLSINRPEGTKGVPQYGHDTWLYDQFKKNMPEEWACVKYAGTDRCMLHRTNGIVTEFVSVNPEATQGAIALGKVKTDKGIVNVEGGWTSRPSIYHYYTGNHVIEVYIGGAGFYLNIEFAQILAAVSGLYIDENMYSMGHSDPETSKSFYKLDTKTCDKCEKPVSARIGYRCEACGHINSK